MRRYGGNLKGRTLMADEPQPLYPTLIPVAEELRGPRVTLRRQRLSDAEDFFAALDASRAHLAPWLRFPDHILTLDDARHVIICDESSWLLRQALRFAIRHNSTSEYLGGVDLHHVDWDIRAFEIGYWLRAGADGHGYMTEAVGLAVDYCFTDPHLAFNKAIIRCDARNTRSAAVAERLGFTREALLRADSRGKDGSLVDELVYGRLRAGVTSQ